MIIREKEPANLEMPFSALESFITPNHEFYVRSHFAMPKIDLARWRLRIEGAVARPLELSHADLGGRRMITRPVTMECAGNSRIFLQPKAKGVQWEMGAVGNAEWTGVSLGELLAEAGCAENACEVILEGADSGTIAEPPRPAGQVHYSRSLSLGKAGRDVLLALQMNGEPLTPAHGFPLRAIVPGWYAVASVKWLKRIIITDKPFNGYYQTLDYAVWKREGNQARLTSLSSIQTKAVIISPAKGETVPANSSVRLRGGAWTGNGEIRKVDVSADNGKTWHEAKLLGDSKLNAWRLWEFNWKTPAQSGKATLIARATDSKGGTQPLERDPDRGSYMINHLLPVEVNVS